jgi:Flp pilus assembly protein TadG
VVRGWRDDRGSAVVEFVMVGVLLLAVFLAVVQLGVTLHVRNTLVAAAAEGARYAANADRGPAEGAQRAQELIAQSLSAAYAQDVTAGAELVGGVETVVVRVRAPVPVVGFVDVVPALDVEGHAFEEAQ